ncbi:hypothetical protein EC973_009644 [Apophysomyces ossiformis]|uniref:Uncharacterized protein n=1 Tax=Apophysomyces ossiformis TaxID=679940 RepID=A0A8H7EQ73_9FUNG|nr:hypothetical protein EC973_009644 [Apophysomyces ossiformis]
MVQYLIAVWDYTAEGEFELSFKQGDRIKLLEKHNDDWWEGELNDEIGFFPANRIRIETERESQNTNHELQQQQQQQTILVDIVQEVGALGAFAKREQRKIESEKQHHEPESIAFTNSASTPATIQQLQTVQTDNMLGIINNTDHNQSQLIDVTTPSSQEKSVLSNLDPYAGIASEHVKDTILVDVSGDPGNLPEGWKHTYDEDGTIYYFNEHTGESRWERPDESVLLSPADDMGLRFESMALQHSEDLESIHEGLQKLSPDELKRLEYDQLQADWIRQQGLVQMKMKAEKEDGGKLSSWKVYYAVLSNGFLLLYKENIRAKKPPKPLLPVGSFDLDCCQIEPAGKQDTRRKYVFLITTPTKVKIYIQTAGEKDFSTWLDAIMRELIARREGQREDTDLDDKDRKHLAEKPKHRHWFSKSGRGSEKLAVQAASEQPGSSTGNDVFGGFLRLNSQGNVPSVVSLCIKEVEERGMESVGIYRLSGPASTIQKYRSIFNCNEPVSFADEHDINVMTGLLKLYLRELKNPLLTYEYYDWFIEAARIPDYDERMFRIKSIIHVLPKPHYIVLEYLMRHLNRVAMYSEINKMEASNLALIFSVGLLRSSSENLSSIMHADLHNKIIEAIIQQVDWFFEIDDEDGLEREPLTGGIE